MRYALLEAYAVRLGRRKAMPILATLAVSGEHQFRESLLALLWPDYDASSGRTNLRRDLSYLRRTLKGEHLSADRNQVQLDLSAGLRVDVRHFRELLAEVPDSSSVGHLTKAVALHTGEFMAGFGLPDAPEFDEWLFFERESLRRELATALQQLVRHHRGQGEYEDAIAFGRRWLSLEPLHEPAHRELMKLCAWSDQRAAASRQYEACVRLLEEELGVAPEEETTVLHEAIALKRLEMPDRATPQERKEAEEQRSRGTPELAAGERVAFTEIVHNLPGQGTPFLGRGGELVELAALLIKPDVRLVTIVGLGGMGKTRLALAVAERIVVDALHASSAPFPDGVYFVPLATMSEPDQIPPAVAEALGFRFYGAAPPREQLQRQLRDQNLLLVLDNFEQLASSAEWLTPLLAAAPVLKLLVTSRQRLNLAQEWTFELLGLPYPPAEKPAASPEKLLGRYEALQLFAQRARQADGGFVPTDENLPHIMRICQLVGGMPLALEMAAAWRALISCREIAEEIGRNLDFLASAMRDVPERHRSLRAVFRHSWSLLSPDEKAVFRKLSVFRGGFSREAAVEVADASLPLLAELSRKSLIRRGSDGHYEIHELLRQYAAEHLAEDASDEGVTCEAHAAYFARFMQARENALYGRRQTEVLHEIAVEIDNVRQAWRWAVLLRDPVKLSQMLESFKHFCEMRGLLAQGVAAFRQASKALRESGDDETAKARRKTRGSLLMRQGFLQCRIGEWDKGIALMRKGVELLREAGPEAHLDLATGLNELGLMGYMAGHGANVARQRLAESLDLAMRNGDDRRTGNALCYLGHVDEFQGRFREADEHFRASVEILDQAGERFALGYSLNNRGRAVYAMGDYPLAEHLIESALAMRRGAGDEVAIAYSLLDLGSLARMRGDYSLADKYIEESLEICQRLGLLDTMARCFNGLGVLEKATGRYAEADEAHRRSLNIYREIKVQRELPHTLNGLAAVAPAQEKYQKASQYLLESFGIAAELDNVGDKAEALNLLGNLAAAESRWQEARDYYRQALLITNETGAAPLALEVLVGVAVLDQARPDPYPERAADLLSLVQSHPAVTRETREKAEAMASRRAERQRRRGREGLTLEAAVEEIVAELGGTGKSGRF